MMDPARSRAEIWVPRLAGLAAFAAFAWLVAPGPYWLDSQELGAAGARWGVPHPTGFPLFCVLARAATLVPVGEVAWRIHMLSAVCGAVTVALVARAVVEAVGRDMVAIVAGAAAGLLLAAGTTFSRQATVTEVYAPSAMLLALAIVWLGRVVRDASRPHGLALALVFGVAATGVHASVRLLLIVPLVACLVWLLRRGARWALAAPALVLVGALGMAAYLPVRSASKQAPALDWGHPRDAGALADHLAAGRIRRAFEREMFVAGGTAARAAGVAGQAEEDLGVVGLLVVAGGAVWMVWRRRGLGAALVAIAIGDVAYAVWVNPMGAAERQNGVPLVVAAAVLAGAGVAAGARRLGRAAPYAAGALGAIALVQPALESGDRRLATARDDSPRAYAELALAQAPAGALVLTQSDSLAAGILWLTEVEQARPDVAMLARQHLWDERRNRAVLAAAAFPDDARTLPAIARAGRPLRWEIGVDAPPPELHVEGDVPLGVAGGGGGAGVDPARSVTALEHVFAGARGDPHAARTAARAFTNLGALLAARGHMREAARATALAARHDPGSVTAWLNGARYASALSDYEAARAAAARATWLDPSRAAAWALLGVAEANLGQCEQALAHLDRALAIDPAEPDAAPNRPLVAERCGRRLP